MNVGKVTRDVGDKNRLIVYTEPRSLALDGEKSWNVFPQNLNFSSAALYMLVCK